MKKTALVLLSCVCFLLCASCKSNAGDFAVPEEPSLSKKGWTLYWHDEFDGNSINTGDWNIENLKWPYSGELEYYTGRSQNLSVTGGELVITALKEDYNGAQYTSARINTKSKIQSAYGYIEARIKMPYGKGMWPAFWTLMEPASYPTWYGEIDIVEMTGGGEDKDNVVYGTAHWGDGAIVSNGTSTGISWPAKLADDYHVYAIEWDSTMIKWYMDGALYHTVDVSSAEQDELRSAQYIILNIAVGGTWPGSPNDTTVWPQTMKVDWVRWWKKS